MYKNNVSKRERKENIQKVLITSLINTPSITKKKKKKKVSHANPPPICMTTLILKLLPLFVTSDKG